MSIEGIFVGMNLKTGTHQTT